MGGKGRGWHGDSRLHSLARKGISTNIDEKRRFDVSNFVARGIQHRQLTELTPEEEHAWDFAWTFYEDEYPDDNERAKKIWSDLQIEFPRLKKFQGIASGELQFKTPIGHEQAFMQELRANTVSDTGTDAYYSDPHNYVTVIMRIPHNHDQMKRKALQIAKKHNAILKYEGE